LLRRFRDRVHGRRWDRSCGGPKFSCFAQAWITVRKIIDLLIGTWCIEPRMPLLRFPSDGAASGAN